MRPTHIISLMVLAAVSCLGACAGQGKSEAVNEREEASGPGTLVRRTIRSAGDDRTYDIYVPASASGPLPLVIALHGGGGNSSSMVASAGWVKKAKAEGFIAVFPNGVGRMEKRYTWNAGGCCAFAMTEKSPDVKFIGDLIDAVEASEPVDRQRVYLTGMSNGGMLTFRVAAELGDKLSAVGTVVGAMFEDQPLPKGNMPIVMINAVQDGVVPYDGGMSPMPLVRKSQTAPFLPARETAKRWASWNHCSGEPLAARKASVVTETFEGCTADTVFITLEEGGHGWPGGQALRESPEQASGAISATDELWAFFKEQVRADHD
ncbi:MAG: PHB depolymerase family esterase [Hyphomonas sp.]